MPRSRAISVLLVASLLLSNSAVFAQDAQHPDALPVASAGAAYKYDFRLADDETRASGALKWSLRSGELPPGLALDPSGTLSGNIAATISGRFVFEVQVQDATGASGTMWFALEVRPHLRIARATAPLKIAPATQEPQKKEPAPVPTPLQPVPSREPEPPAPVPPPAYQAPSAAPSLGLFTRRPLATNSTGGSGEAGGAGKSTASIPPPTPISPASYIAIYEDTGRGNHIPLYLPGDAGTQKHQRLTVDEDSMIVIIPDPKQMGDVAGLNKLFMSAELHAKDAKSNVEVQGYSEIGKDRSTTAAQRGMAFESAANLQAMVLNMAHTARTIAAAACNKPETDWTFRYDPKTCSDTIAEEYLRIAAPELKAISDFFLKDENMALTEIIGTEVFWMDRDSVRLVAAQLKDSYALAFGDEVRTQAVGRKILLSRIGMIHNDFAEIRQEIEALAKAAAQGEQAYFDSLSRDRRLDEKGNTKSATNVLSDTERELVTLAQKVRENPNDQNLAALLPAKATQVYAEEWRAEAFEKLKRLFAPGTISLRAAKAKDGNLLTVIIEAAGLNGQSTGVRFPVEIEIKKYGAKLHWASSFFFLKRMNLGQADINPPTTTPPTQPIRAVNFAPSPGVSYGVNFFKRGDDAGSRFLRALSPGLAMNVSFMNFDDPGFDLSTGQFTNTNGTNVQVGTGIVTSLFHNMIQFTYGWNLNVDRKREYWGVGFGFVEIATALKDRFKKD